MSEVTCLDLQPLQEAVGEHFDGVLGMDALGEFVVQIDFDCGKLSILPFVPEDAGESIKMARCIGQRAFELGWLGEDPGLFLIDTGYVSLDSGTLSPRRFQSLLDSQQATLIADGTAPPSARATQTRKARQADFSLGDFKHRDLLFSEGLYNVLSLGYLSRYFVTIDFQFGRIYLKPGARFAAKDLRDLSGLELAKIGDDVVIQSVAPQSGGDRAGLQAGDVIVEIDETGVDSLALLDVRRKLSMPSTRSITINRGAADQQITLDLREEAAGGKQPIPH